MVIRDPCGVGFEELEQVWVADVTHAKNSKPCELCGNVAMRPAVVWERNLRGEEGQVRHLGDKVVHATGYGVELLRGVELHAHLQAKEHLADLVFTRLADHREMQLEVVKRLPVHDLFGPVLDVANVELRQVVTTKHRVDEEGLPTSAPDFPSLVLRREDARGRRTCGTRRGYPRFPPTPCRPSHGVNVAPLDQARVRARYGRVMANLMLITYFELEGLLIRPEAAGALVVINRDDGVMVRIDLPDGPAAFRFERVMVSIKREIPEPREYSPVTCLLDGGTPEVRIVRAVVTTRTDVGFWDFTDWSQPPAKNVEEATRSRLVAACAETVTAFVEWVWAEKGQVWNSSSGEYPKLVSSEPLLDLDAGRQFPVRSAIGQRINIVASKAIVTSDDVHTLGRLVERHGRPGLPELLLAEGRHFLFRQERLAPDRAVVLAAMALEIQVRTALRDRTSGQAHDLLELVLNNPRDWSLAAAALWDKALEAAFGRSLRREEGATYKRLRPSV